MYQMGQATSAATIHNIMVQRFQHLLVHGNDAFMMTVICRALPTVVFVVVQDGQRMSFRFDGRLSPGNSHADHQSICGGNRVAVGKILKLSESTQQFHVPKP